MTQTVMQSQHAQVLLVSSLSMLPKPLEAMHGRSTNGERHQVTSSKHDGAARVPIVRTSLLFQCPSTRPPATRFAGALCTRCISTPSNPKTHLCFGSSASHQPCGPQMSALSTPWGCVHPGSLPFSS